MAKSARHFALFHDLESSYGEGGTPGVAAKALLAFNAAPPNLRAQKRERSFIQPYFGARPSDLDAKVYPYAYGLELVGGGTAGTAPPIAEPLLTAGLAEVVRSGTAAIDSAVVKTNATAGMFTLVVAAAGTPKVRRKVTFTCTTAGGSGTAAFTVAAPATGKGACAENAYNETGVVMTDEGSFALPNGVEITPTITVALVMGATFEMWIGPACVEYWPTSDRANHASGIAHRYDNDKRKIIVGNRGNLRIAANKGTHPMALLDMMGLYAKPTKETMLGPDTSGFRKPSLVNIDHTWLFELFGQALVMETCEINFNNQMEFIDRVGRREVTIGDRAIRGTFSFEEVDLETKDFFAAIDTRATGGFRMVHGLTPGEIVDIEGFRLMLDPLEERDSQGDSMNNLTADFLPVDTQNGDDEFVIRFY